MSLQRVSDRKERRIFKAIKPEASSACGLRVTGRSLFSHECDRICDAAQRIKIGRSLRTGEAGEVFDARMGAISDTDCKDRRGRYAVASSVAMTWTT